MVYIINKSMVACQGASAPDTDYEEESGKGGGAGANPTW